MKRLILVLGLIALLALPALAQESIEVGQTIEGNFEGGPSLVFTLTLKEGDSVAINLSSSDFDTFLELYDSNAVMLASDDDSGGSLNSRIIFTAPAAGSYPIHVRSFSSGGGAFTLSVERFQITPIAYGETIEVAGPERCSFVFGFTGAEGDVIDVVLSTSEDMDSYSNSFTLTDPNGLITYSDFGAPQLRRYALSASGEYRIAVDIAAETCAAGTALQMSLTQSERIFLSADPVEVTFDSIEIFDFTAEAGKTYRFTIDLNPAGRSLSFNITNPRFYQDMSFNFSGSNRLSIDFPFEQGGDYRLEARSYFDFTGLGAITMTVSVVEVTR